MVGSHVIKSYSKQQRTIALSSAEAELHAMVAASAECLGIMALRKDMSRIMAGDIYIYIYIYIYSDSSAALGIAQRQGIGKLRHVRTQALWVQEVRSEGRLGYHKVLGSRNPSDAMTKYMTSVLLEQHLTTVGMESRGGRAETAPGLDSVEAYTEGWMNKRVRFHGKIGIVRIPLCGKGRTVDGGKDSKWHKNIVTSDGIGHDSQGTTPRGSTIESQEGAQQVGEDAAK